jgi:hypothetical protein
VEISGKSVTEVWPANFKIWLYLPRPAVLVPGSTDDILEGVTKGFVTGFNKA